MTKTLIGIATYNESKNITSLIEKILKNTKDTLDILIVDDNSPDGTSGIIIELQKKINNLILITRKKKLGLGSAHKRIILYAQQNNYSKLLTMDADFSHSPNAIPDLLEYSTEENFVIGSRYATGGTCDYLGYRKYISLIGNIFARKLLSIPSKEVTTSFRVFSKKILDTIDLNFINSDGYAFMVEVIHTINLNSFAIKERPIHFFDRLEDKSKIPRLQLIYSLINLFRLFIFRKKMSKKKIDKTVSCKNCTSSALLRHRKLNIFNIGLYYKCLDCGLTQQENKT